MQLSIFFLQLREKVNTFKIALMCVFDILYLHSKYLTVINTFEMPQVYHEFNVLNFLHYSPVT